MKFKRHLKIAGINNTLLMVPLASLVLLLFLFLVIDGRTVAQPGVAIEMPAFLTSGMLSFAERQILLSADSAVYWDNTKVSEEELKSVLAKLALRKEPLLIKVDARAELGKVARVWDLCRQAGVSQVYLATD